MAFAFVTLIIGIAITEMSVHDAKNISQKDAENAKQAAQDLLGEAPSIGSFRVKFVVREKRQDKFYLDSHSVFGIKFATLKVGLEPVTRQWNYIELNPHSFP